MALTDDQKAMLRLLAQREEGYEDMAAVMGISVDEVRSRVKEALTEVDQPEPSEEAVEPPSIPAPPAPEPEPALTQPAPEKQPEPPAPVTEPAKPAAAPPGRSARGPKRAAQRPSLKMPKDRGALVGLAAGALVLAIFIVVLLVSGGDDSGSDSTAATGSGQSDTSPVTAEDNKNLTQAILAPVNGGDAGGRALFGRFKKNVLLQVEAEGLEPSAEGESYTVWLYRSPKLALQIGAVSVPESGKIAAQFQIPAELLTYVASGAFDQVDVSLTSDAEYRAAFAKAKKERQLPPYLGESVLRGQITGPAIR